MKIEEKMMEQTRMKRVWLVYSDNEYQQCLKKTKELEKTRVYCGHDFGHLLDVARLAYLFSLERHYVLEKELIYVTALLHDIGRWVEYETGVSHDVAGAEISERIMRRYEFSEEEIMLVTSAILSHRGNGTMSIENEADLEQSDVTSQIAKLQEVLYDADKMSRNCYVCESLETCNWSEEKKNLRIIW